MEREPTSRPSMASCASALRYVHTEPSSASRGECGNWKPSPFLAGRCLNTATSRFESWSGPLPNRLPRPAGSRSHPLCHPRLRRPSGGVWEQRVTGSRGPGRVLRRGARCACERDCLKPTPSQPPPDPLDPSLVRYGVLDDSQTAASRSGRPDERRRSGARPRPHWRQPGRVRRAAAADAGADRQRRARTRAVAARHGRSPSRGSPDVRSR